jgi:ABC-type Zn uptake system ZnuABC Zn-binding protein ZnuA
MNILSLPKAVFRRTRMRSETFSPVYVTSKACLITAGLLVLVLTGCGSIAPRGEPVKVVASIAPLADWARRVGGEHVAVELVVPPGLDPRAYEPAPRQRAAIANADVVLMNGLGVEPWIEEILEHPSNDRLIVLEMAQFTGPLTERVPRKRYVEPGEPLAGGTRGDEAWVPAPVYSPYLWLDVGSAMLQVELIAQTLGRADTQRILDYQQNAARYNAELQNLNTSVAHQLESWQWRSILSTNRFLYPFARHYQLPILLVGEPARRPGLPLVQPLFVDGLVGSDPPRTGSSGRPVVLLNSLGAENYLELMEAMVDGMTAAMVGS